MSFSNFTFLCYAMHWLKQQVLSASADKQILFMPVQCRENKNKIGLLKSA